MAEILIKNMEMQKYCRHCSFESSSIHGQYCILTKKFTRLDDNEDGSKRHISCPLVEVPTHGDLIDRQETRKQILKDLSKMKINLPSDVFGFIIDRIDFLLTKAPTIVEATNGSDN